MVSEPNLTKKYHSSVPTAWDQHAEQYNNAAGRSSSLGISHLISLVQTIENPSLSAPDAQAIDLGAGTGFLAFQLAKQYPRLPILATDISSSMLDQITTSPCATSNITTQIADMHTPIGGSAGEGLFSHLFSTMAIQVLYDPVGEGILAEWAHLLRPDGIIAIAIWDFDQTCGPHALWAEAATMVDPSYVNPAILPEGHFFGLAQLKEGLKAAGFRDIKAETYSVGFDLGKEGFMQFFWESRNPMPLERQASFKGDLTKVKKAMECLLENVYDGGNNIPMSIGCVVGRRPTVD